MKLKDTIKESWLKTEDEKPSFTTEEKREILGRIKEESIWNRNRLF